MNHLPYNSILIHYGEIGLKGKNRGFFVDVLRDNLFLKFESYLSSLQIGYKYSYFYIKNISLSLNEFQNIASKITEVFGVANYAPAFILNRSKDDNSAIDDIKSKVNTIIKYYDDKINPSTTFAIAARRGDKNFHLNSKQLEILLGDYVFQSSSLKKVDLENPDITFYVDIYQDHIFVYTEKIQGPYGLPVGVTGKALSLLSGGIDSPVASYLSAKRGLEVDYIHFAVSKPENLKNDKIYKLYLQLKRYTISSRLFIAPYIHFNIAILDKRTDYELILFRRFMLKVAEKMGLHIGSQAIVTGDNLAQVASQTLSNIHTADKAVDMPVLRPLLTYDKNEIINLAKKIGTYDISLLPYKDCCSIISRHPRTKSDPEIISRIEDEIFTDYDSMIDKTINDIITIEE